MDNTTTTQYTQYFVTMSAQLGSIDAKLQNVCDKLADHEARISKIESHGVHQIKDNIVKWLVMCLLGSISVIVTLTGSGALLNKLLAN